MLVLKLRFLNAGKTIGRVFAKHGCSSWMMTYRKIKMDNSNILLECLQ